MSAGEDCSSGDTKMKINGIFKSLDAVKNVLHHEKYFNRPEVQELLKIFSDHFLVDNDTEVERSKRKVFIVLEGIDASGKTTISRKLSTLINGRQLSTPPEVFLELREKFDAQELELRKAYYALGNYLVAQQVKQIYKTIPVIMDRFWHSTAAYTIAENAVNNDNGTVPPEGHEVYEWPQDLLKPDIVFLLSVSETKRLERLMWRKSKPITKEEFKLQDNQDLREALLKTFLHMVNPKVRHINADRSIKAVIKACMNTLTGERFIKIENTVKYETDN